MIVSNIKKLFFLRNRKVKNSFVEPVWTFISISMILFFMVFIGARMNKMVSEANGGKMPVYDRLYYEGMYDDDPKHQNADINTKLPWLADWIVFNPDTKTKIFIGNLIGAPRIDEKGMPISTYFLSPGDIMMSASYNLFNLFFVLFLLWYPLLILIFIFGENYIFEED